MDLLSIIRLARTAPLSQGVSTTVEHFIEGCRDILPAHAVGACVVNGSNGTPIVVTRVPEGGPSSLGRDPSRLFPGFADEHVVELEDIAGGSTFHVARQNEAVEEVDRATARIIAEVLGSMLAHARKFENDENETKHLALLQRQMIQTEKLASLGQIVAGVVHELNNPLTSIIAYSDYLKKRALLRDQGGAEVSDDVERLSRIGEAAERILRFSRDLVAYARPSTDIPGPVSLPDVIDKAIVFCEHEFSKSSVVVQKRLEPNLPLVRGIAGQLTQVFVNLFTNAAHAMLGNGGALDIIAERADEETVIASIADEGAGIATEDIEQIFEPFFTTKVEGVGTGLGLAIVRDIVTQHGGNLTAARRDGGGTVFTLHLPVVALPSTLRP